MKHDPRAPPLDSKHVHAKELSEPTQMMLLGESAAWLS